MFVISHGIWTVAATTGSLPDMYDEYRRHAVLVDEIDMKSDAGSPCFIGISGPDSNRIGWPQIVIAQRYEPHQAGFNPGALIAPETAILFVGAGTRLLAYDLYKSSRIWEDCADLGFLSWRQHGNFVLMSAEIELAAWTAGGKKLWSTFAEPPWDYAVSGDRVELDVMGNKSSFDIATGPGAG